MVQTRESGRAAGPRVPEEKRSSPVVLLLSLAIAAAKSDGLDRLLSRDQLFVPYFTT